MIVPEKRILADNLIEYRKKHHMSQYEMAEECGISKETLSLMERESINPTLETIQKCAAYIGEPVAQLLSRHKTIQIGDKDMNFSYCSIKHKASDKYIGTYTTYGIGLVSNTNNKSIEFLDFIADICIDYDKVNYLVCLLNSFEISSVHFRDIIEDYITNI